MRIIDLGCGVGQPPMRAAVKPDDEVIGLDIDESRLRTARERNPGRLFICSQGERLPFPDKSFDRVVSAVALPYMDIPKTLSESYRVLSPGGTVFFSVHPLRFTIGELKSSFPRLVAAAFRVYVMLNGLYFHLTGRVLPRESFQTRRGLKIALRREGFVDVEFERPNGRLIVRARKPAA